MKLTIEPSEEILLLDGSPARVWTGEDEHGVLVRCFIRTVSPQTHDEAVNARYARELAAQEDMRFIGVAVLDPEG